MKTHLGVEMERFVEEFAPIEATDLETGEVRLVSSGQDKFGREVPDGVPMEVPLGYTHPPTLSDMIRRMVHHEGLRAKADEEGFDTVEEADDFEIEDDPLDPLTPYEAVFDPVLGAPPREAPAAPVQEAAKLAEPSSAPGVASPPASAPESPSTST